MDTDNETKMNEGDHLLILNCYSESNGPQSLRGTTLQTMAALDPTVSYTSKKERPWEEWFDKANAWAENIIGKAGRAILSGGGPLTLFTRIGMTLRDTKDVCVIAQNGERFEIKKEALHETRPVTRNRVEQRLGFLKKDIVWDDTVAEGCFFMFLRLSAQHKLRETDLDSIREDTQMEIRGVCILECPLEEGRLTTENATKVAKETFERVADAVQVAADDEASKVICFATSAPAALALAAGAALKPNTFPGDVCLMDRDYEAKGYRSVWAYVEE